MGDGVVAGGRREYWFPLVSLGFGLLALIGWLSVRADQYVGWFDYQPLPSGLGHGGVGGTALPESNVIRAYVTTDETPVLGDLPAHSWEWALLVTVTLVVSAAWYAWRARRAGASMGPYVALAVGGAIAVPTGYVASVVANVSADPMGLVKSVAVPLVALGVLTGAWAYYRLAPERRALAGAVSVLCLAVGGATMLGLWLPGLFVPVLVVCGLLALARFTRSRLLVLVAAAMLVAMLVFRTGTLSMLIPAAIALAAGIVALVRQAGEPVPSS